MGKNLVKLFGISLLGVIVFQIGLWGVSASNTFLVIMGTFLIFVVLPTVLYNLFKRYFK